MILAIIYKKKVVLAPRGEFSREALSLKAFKKNIYIFFFNVLRLKIKFVGI